MIHFAQKFVIVVVVVFFSLLCFACSLIWFVFIWNTDRRFVSYTVWRFPFSSQIYIEDEQYYSVDSEFLYVCVGAKVGVFLMVHKSYNKTLLRTLKWMFVSFVKCCFHSKSWAPPSCRLTLFFHIFIILQFAGYVCLFVQVGNSYMWHLYFWQTLANLYIYAPLICYM